MGHCIYITQTLVIRKFIQKNSLEVSYDLVMDCYIMSRAKGKRVSKKAKAMPASKKKALLNGKKGNGKSSGTVFKANEVMDKFLNEVSKKLEKGPVAKGNPSPKQLKGLRKRTSGRKKTRKGPSRANTMKTTQGAGAQVKGGNDAKSEKSVDSNTKKTAGKRKGSKSGNATHSKYAEVDSDFDAEENEEVEGESEVGSDWEEPEEEMESDNGSDDKNYSPKQGSVKRKAKPSKGKAKKKKTNKKASKKSSATANKDLSEDEFDEEETETESEEEAENDDNDYSPKQGPKKKKLKRKASKKKGKT